MSDDFEALVRKYQKLVISLINRYYGGRLRENADDLAQEVWTKLWMSFKKNESNMVSFKSYLYKTVQTTLWDAIRSVEKESVVDSISDEADPSVPTDERQVHAQIDLDRLLEGLKPDEAQMVRAHLKGFSYQETALLLGVSEGRVRNLLSRVKKKLVIKGGG